MLSTTWHVVGIETGQDRRVSKILEMRDIEHYIPYAKEPYYRGHSRGQTNGPNAPLIALLPGYAFVRAHQGTAQLRYALDTCAHVYGLVTFGVDPKLKETQYAQLTELDVEQLRALADVHGARPWDWNRKPLTIKHPVQIVEGPLQGLHGFVARFGNKEHVIVTLEMLNRAVEIPFAPWELRPVQQAVTQAHSPLKYMA